MSIVDKLTASIAKRGAALIDEKGEAFITRLVDTGRKALASPAATGLLPDDASRQTLSKALTLIDEERQPFVRLTSIGFAQLTAHWLDGKEADARRLYLATQATYDERRAAMQAAGDAAAREREERDAAWAKVESVLKTIGTVGLKLILKVAAGSMGIPLPV